MTELELVIVHYGANPAEAEVVRTVLESNGITAMIPYANNPTTPYDGESGLSGCEVAVTAADVDKAREAIAAARASGGGDGDGDGDDEE